MFSSNKLLKLKYIHHYFFLKFLTKESWCVLWAGASYGPGNTVLTYLTSTLCPYSTINTTNPMASFYCGGSTQKLAALILSLASLM